MKPYTFALAAGVAMPLPIGGSYFFLDSAPNGGVDVEFYGPSGMKRDNKLEAIIAGTWARGDFAHMKITSATSQTVVFYVGVGEVGVNRFSGQVSGSLAVLLQLASLGQNLLAVQDQGQSYGTKYTDNTNYAGVTSVQILAPASNVNGVRVARGGFYGTNNAGFSGPFALHAHTASPAAFTDGDILCMIEKTFLLTTPFAFYSGKLVNALRIAIGKGLYWRHSGATAEATGAHELLYTVL